jgi:hypothetical protein
MSFREPNGVVMTANMKLLGWKRRIVASSLRGLRFATNQKGQAAKEKKQNVVAGAGCSENSSGFRLKEKCFSLDIPFYRTSEVFHGKRSISKTQAKKLARFFHVSAELFI